MLAQQQQVCIFIYFLFTLSESVCREAHIVFKLGKNCDGYFDAKALITQVDRAIDIFEDKTNGLAQGLFMFDNAPSHLKRALNAISATKMVKSVYSCVYLFIYFVLSMSSKIPSVFGRTIQMGHACAMESIH
jgi:hypothetical protein